MKKYKIILLFVTAIVFTGCSEFLDRQSKTTMNDGNYWTSENNLRLFANGFYPNYFVGYNSAWGVDYAPLRGYYFSDDVTSTGKQSGFETTAPASRASTSESPSMLITYAGPSWNFAYVRKSNLFLERIDVILGIGRGKSFFSRLPLFQNFPIKVFFELNGLAAYFWFGKFDQNVVPIKD